MLFSEELKRRLEQDAAIGSRMQSCALSAEEVWDLDLRVEWDGVGPLHIRPAVLDDQPALRAFLTEGLGERSRFLFAPYPLDERLDPCIRDALEATGRREQLTFNAMQGDSVAGHFFLWKFTEAVPELGIAVADRFHANKLGRLFMHLLIAAARVSGKKQVALTTHPTNEPGFHLYSEMGFVHVGDKTITLGDGSHRTEREMMLEVDGR